MTKRILKALAACATIVLGAGSVEAQTPETAEDVVAAAVDHVRSSLLASGAIREGARVGIDVAVIPQEASEPKRDNRARAEGVARRTGVAVADVAEAIQCGEGPPSCRMDFDAFLTFSEPTVEGDSATVLVLRRLWTPDRTRQPISWMEWKLTLARSEGQWAVVDEELMQLS